MPERRAVAAECRVALPKDFRAADFLAFHGRDAQAVAERVGAHSLEKGLVWDGHPALLRVSLHGGFAEATLAVDAGTVTAKRLEQLVPRMLGLTQDVASFERRFRHHNWIGPLLAQRPGLRVPVAATPFEALVWAITGQQISVGVAISIRRKLIEACGAVHSSGIACHPDAERIAALGEESLRAAGYSRAKAATLHALAEDVASDQLPLEAWLDTIPAARIAETLLARLGIGPWTVDYALLRGFGWLDGSLHGDVAVRRKLQLLLGAAEMPTPQFTRDWLAEFAPWRALVAAHLWAMRT